jgi:hypothetical protein
LSLVTELDRPPEPTLSDRPGVGVVQADLPSGAVGDLAGEPFPGLLDDRLPSLLPDTHGDEPRLRLCGRRR